MLCFPQVYNPAGGGLRALCPMVRAHTGTYVPTCRGGTLRGASLTETLGKRLTLLGSSGGVVNETKCVRDDTHCSRQQWQLLKMLQQHPFPHNWRVFSFIEMRATLKDFLNRKFSLWSRLAQPRVWLTDGLSKCFQCRFFDGFVNQASHYCKINTFFYFTQKMCC